MSFRLRIALATAAAVAFAVAVASVSTYVVLRHVTRQQVDESLVLEARRLQDTSHVGDLGTPAMDVPTPVGAGEGGGFTYQFVTEAGEVSPQLDTDPGLPVTDAMRAVALGQRGALFADTREGGVHRRLLTVNVAPNLALQVARDVREVDRTRRRLAAVLTLIGIAGVGMGAALGWLVSRAATRPLVDLHAAVEKATATGDLRQGISVPGHDELARLGQSFNSLFAGLDQSLRAQRQLVADAAHELRTPLTSLRTNVEVLTRSGGVSATDRAQLVGDVLAQLEELTVLLGDLTELAREDETPPALEEVRLDQLVESVTDRMAARARAAGVRIDTRLTPTRVLGSPARLERAAANLLDNAVKWSPPGASVEVSVADGEVVVRDHGPGIADDDLPLVFERFYRAPAARELPGSGLGLAIVRKVAENHGGTVVAETPVDGGARLRLWVPPATQARDDGASAMR